MITGTDWHRLDHPRTLNVLGRHLSDDASVNPFLYDCLPDDDWPTNRTRYQRGCSKLAVEVKGVKESVVGPAVH